MEVKYNMKIVICPNTQCMSPIRLSEGRFVGGDNDKGGLVIECSNCKTIFPCRIRNPRDAARIEKNGNYLDYWEDDMPESIKQKYDISENMLDKLDISIVFNYEKPLVIPWNPSTYGLFCIENINYEYLAEAALKQYLDKINSNYHAYEMLYVKGRHTAEKSFVIINYVHEGKNNKATFAKKIDSESDLNSENLYLIHHSGINFEYQVDGIYTRDQSMTFLERFLNRWRYLSDEVLLVVPFIGFHYKNSEEALYELWNWLEINVDIEKTKLVTRKGTFNLFKRAQDNSGIPFDELFKLGLLEPLVEKMTQKDTEFFQKSHAKYYVGVFKEYVEVLSGSFNIHTGKYFENISFKRYSKDFFSKRYLHMFTDYKYNEAERNESVHYMILGTEQDKNFLIGLDELFNLIE